MLLILLDAADEPEERYETLIREITQYGQGLSEKPRLVALNKMDLFADPESAAQEVREDGPEGGAEKARRGDREGDPERVAPRFGGEPVFLISAVRGDGLKELLGAVWRMLEQSD